MRRGSEHQAYVNPEVYSGPVSETAQAGDDRGRWPDRWDETDVETIGDLALPVESPSVRHMTTSGD
jgi:hypothetical protein